MKYLKSHLLASLVLLFISVSANAETVKLKITYNGAAAQGHTVYIIVGGSSLGSGVTNNSGEVDINVSSILSRSLDLKGEKTCNNAEKTWSLSGWCNLDGNNYCHVKMEEPLNEMSESMGLSADMLAAGWGLTCSGGSSSDESSSPFKNDESASSSSSDEPEAVEESKPMTPQEMAAQRKANLEQSIAAIDAKIERKEAKFEKNRGKMEMDEIMLHGLEIEELTTKKELQQIELEEQTLKTTKVMLNKSERTDFKARKNAKKARLDEIKAEKKNVKKGKGAPSVKDEGSTNSEAESVESGATDVATPINYADMSDLEISKEKAILRTESGKIKAKIKLRGKKMSDSEIIEKEQRIEEIRLEIEVIQLEQDSRKGK